MKFDAPTVILILQVVQLLGLAVGLLKVGQWIGRVGTLLEVNDRDHKRYEQHIMEQGGD